MTGKTHPESISRVSRWLHETHGPGFELLRHFLLRFFDTGLVTTPGQTSRMLIAAIPVFFQWFFLLAFPLKHKYAYLAGLPSRGPCGEAIQADELWLTTMMMSAIGLLTALKWRSLFPDLRDYRVLGSLPLRSRQIFSARLAALLVVAMAALVTLNTLPSLGFPALSAQCREPGVSYASQALDHAQACLAASAFSFFGLVALQGILLNVLPARAFAGLSRNLQGILVAVMLAMLVGSFSIQPQVTNVLLRPQWSPWLPPVWFLGLYQTFPANHLPGMEALAHRALLALALSLALTLLAWILSFRRRRVLPAEDVAQPPPNSRLGGILLDWFVPDPRQQAILTFMMKGLVRSSYHRVILMSYGGLATAVLFIGWAGMARVFEPSRLMAADFVFYHIMALVVLLMAARHIFSRPVELGANWIFQITECEGRVAWLIAVDRFVLFWDAVLILIVPLPLELRLLGWLGVAEAGLFMALGLLSYDWAFSSWSKIPFTCSHLPGKTPAWMIVACLGVVGVLSILHNFLLALLYMHVLYIVVLALLWTARTRMHRARRQAQAEFRLQYDDLPEPAVRELRLLR